MGIERRTSVVLKLLALGVAALLALPQMQAAEGRLRHRNASSASEAPYARSSKERAYPSQMGRRRFEGNEADVVQLNPRLRGDDRKLVDALIAPPSPSTAPLLNSYGLPVFEDVPPIAYLRGQASRRDFFRPGPID